MIVSDSWMVFVGGTWSGFYGWNSSVGGELRVNTKS